MGDNSKGKNKMAKEKGGCMGLVVGVGTVVGLGAVFVPMMGKWTRATIGNFCFSAAIVCFVIFLAGIVMGLVYRKPRFEDESFGHMLMRWLFGAIATAALFATGFFFFGIGQFQKFAIDAKDKNAQTVEQSSTSETPDK